MDTRQSKLTAPAYQRIEEDLRTRIREREWGVGTMLPSRSRLAKDYGVNLTTLQRGISALLADGTLRADPRRGTFVADAGGLLPGPSAADQPAYDRLLFSPVAQRQALLGILTANRPETLDRPYPFVPYVLRAIERSFADAGGLIELYDLYRVDAPWAQPSQAAESLLEAGVDALVVINIYGEDWYVREILPKVDLRGVPIIYVTPYQMKEDVSHIYYDNRSAGYQAAKHLLRAGYQRVVFFAPYVRQWVEERFVGARGAVADAGCSPDAFEIYPADESRSGDALAVSRAHHYQLTLEACAPGGPLDPARRGRLGLIASNDMAGFGILEAMTSLGWKAGADYGLVGFDDLPPSARLGLTSVRPPLDALGEEAARLAIRFLRGETSVQQVRMRSHLIPRASTRTR